MRKIALIFAAALIGVGSCFLIAGIITSNVVQVCRGPPESSSAMRFLEHGMRSGFGRMPGFKSEERKQICIEQGLFYIGFLMPDGTVYLQTPLEEQKQYSRVVAGLLLVGMACAVVSFHFFLIASCGADRRNPKKEFRAAKHNIQGTVIQSMSVALLIAGVSILTNEKSKAVGHPQTFILQVLSATAGIESASIDLTAAGKTPFNFNPSLDQNRSNVLNERNFGKNNELGMPTKGISVSLITTSQPLLNNTEDQSSNTDLNFTLPISTTQGSRQQVKFRTNSSSYTDFSRTSSTVVSNENSSSHRNSTDNNSPILSDNSTLNNPTNEDLWDEIEEILNSLILTNSHSEDDVLFVEERRKRRAPRRNRFFFSGPNSAGIKMLFQFFDSFPVFGYSIYFLWCGCIFHASALAAGIINWKLACSGRTSRITAYVSA
ncbi:uncharacterized protein LOC143465335 [Clavelina lepadiformis]|uniref:uncharacterized protein LOC143465335 n=1 Tax=Clavelina lepadiformis TaxID=159417 RepID=UPI0040431669